MSFFNENDPGGYDVDDTGKPGLSLVGNAIQFWSSQQDRPTTVSEAAAVFNMPVSAVREAVEDHPYMLLEGPDTDPVIGHDGE